MPATVLGVVLGIPPEDRDQYKRWSDDIGVRLFGTGHATDENLEKARGSVIELYDYLRGLVDYRRRKPADDLISYFIANCNFTEWPARLIRRIDEEGSVLDITWSE